MVPERYEALLERFDRIANALEGIEAKLDYLEDVQVLAEQLNDCIGYEPPSRFAPKGADGKNYHRIGGTVYNG